MFPWVQFRCDCSRGFFFTHCVIFSGILLIPSHGVTMHKSSLSDIKSCSPALLKKHANETIAPMRNHHANMPFTRTVYSTSLYNHITVRVPCAQEPWRLLGNWAREFFSPFSSSIWHFCGAYLNRFKWRAMGWEKANFSAWMAQCPWAWGGGGGEKRKMEKRRRRRCSLCAAWTRLAESNALIRPAGA